MSRISVLVAFIDKSDNFPEWAVEIWQILLPPLFTCESVIFDNSYYYAQIK